jgi:hypothetical protein
MKPVPIATNKGLVAVRPPATVESVEIPWGAETPRVLAGTPAVLVDAIPSPTAPVAVVDV